MTNRNAPFLRNLGKDPDPVELVITAFGLSKTAAQRRLHDLKFDLAIWEYLDNDLYRWIGNIKHRAGWYCWVCHTRRRTASPYCPGCGKGWDYEFQDYGKLSRPTIGLRETGQFEFCSVCGNTEFDDDAICCPICGSPVINECENAFHTDGDFIRSGMRIVRGTHRCKPTDIYCGKCGVLTTFGAQHGPRKNMWLPTKGSARCRTRGTAYPHTLKADNGRLKACSACGSDRSIRDGRYCADCKQPLENGCVPEGTTFHTCAPNDRFCRICGSPTLFFQAGFLPAYTETETYQQLRSEETKAGKQTVPQLMIQPDGDICVLVQEEH